MAEPRAAAGGNVYVENDVLILLLVDWECCVSPAALPGFAELHKLPAGAFGSLSSVISAKSSLLDGGLFVGCLHPHFPKISLYLSRSNIAGRSLHRSKPPCDLSP